MALAQQVYEVVAASNGSFILRVYNTSMVLVGVSSLNEGRTLTSVNTYPNVNALINALKDLIAAQPV